MGIGVSVKSHSDYLSNNFSVKVKGFLCGYTIIYSMIHVSLDILVIIQFLLIKSALQQSSLWMNVCIFDYFLGVSEMWQRVIEMLPGVHTNSPPAFQEAQAIYTATNTSAEFPHTNYILMSNGNFPFICTNTTRKKKPFTITLNNTEVGTIFQFYLPAKNRFSCYFSNCQNRPIFLNQYLKLKGNP